MDPFVGEIRTFGFNFAPQGWALCNGALMSIAGNTALFSLLGTQYGGDGRSTFALPNLSASLPISAGQGLGLQDYVQGQTGGSPTVTMTLAQLAPHVHTLPTAQPATTNTPGTGVFLAGGVGKVAGKLYDDPATQSANAVTMAATTAGLAGGSQPHNNMGPYLVVNYCIAISGVFPQRP